MQYLIPFKKSFQSITLRNKINKNTLKTYLLQSCNARYFHTDTAQTVCFKHDLQRNFLEGYSLVCAAVTEILTKTVT